MLIFFLLLSFLVSVNYGVADPGYNYGTLGDDWPKSSNQCGGKAQSPIDIKTESAREEEFKTCNGQNITWNFAREDYGFAVKDKGFLFELSPVDISSWSSNTNDILDDSNDGTTLKFLNDKKNGEYIANFKNMFSTYTDINTKWCFHSMHFHWADKDSVGSEHVMNGKAFPLELHMVHVSCDYDNLGDAVGQVKYPNVKDKYVLGVIGRIFKVTKDESKKNKELDLILKGVGEAARGDKYTILKKIDLKSFLPTTNRAFYTYKGSLTTPGCLENVRWHVLEDFAWVTESQMAEFRKYKDFSTKLVTANYRKPQSNINEVSKCLQDPADYGSVDMVLVVFICTAGAIALIALIAGAVYNCCAVKKERKNSNEKTLDA